MPAIEIPAQSGSLDTQWVQYVGSSNGGWQGDLSFGQGDSQLAFPIIMPWAALTDFSLYKILGYSRRSNNSLTRNPPWRCPLFYWMRAVRVTQGRGAKWTGKTEYNFNEPFSTYDYFFCTVTFATLPYLCLPDSAVFDVGHGEWERWTFTTQKSTTNAITRKGGDFKYAEGPIEGTAFTGQRTQILSKTRVTVHWVNVPEAYLMRNGIPRSVYALRGKVNSTTFMGYPAETLLFEDPEITPVTLFVNPTLIQTGGGIVTPQGSDMVPRAYDVKLQLLHFDPPTRSVPALSSLTASGTTVTAIFASPHGFTAGRDYVNVSGADPIEYDGQYLVTTGTGSSSLTYEVPVAPATTPAGGTIAATAARGHNLVPHPSNGLWYRAVSNVSSGATPLYASGDFRDAFDPA